MQREPFLTSVWIIICSAVLMSLAMAFFIYQETFLNSYTGPQSLVTSKFWGEMLPEILTFFMPPVLVVLSGFFHLRKGTNRLSAIIILAAALLFGGLCIYVVVHIFPDLQGLYMTVTEGHGRLSEFMLICGIIIALHALSFLGLWTGVSMLRYNPNKVIKPELFE